MAEQKDGLRADLAGLETCELVAELRNREGVESINMLSMAFYGIFTEGKDVRKFGPAIILIVED